MSTAVAVVLENPFPGLRPFREGEEHLFFGRENQVDRMVDKLAATRFLAVVGTSGTGKSSLVNCGLKPALHRGVMASAGSSWSMVYLRPGGQPLRSMARAFAESVFASVQSEGISPLDFVSATLDMSSLGLVDLFECAHFSPGTNLLVVVDQFEELFRYARTGDSREDASGLSGEAVAFVNLLIEASTQRRYPIYIVLTMRSDFLGECAQFDRLPEAMNEGQFLVSRLTRSERRAAIEGPIGVAGADLNPVLLTRLVNDVGENPDQLSILQHAINRTWAFWQKEGGYPAPLSLEHYENPLVGTMARALDLHAEEALAELKTAVAQKRCEKIFKALTDKGTDARGIRRPMALKDLCAVIGASQEEAVAVIDVFREPSRSFLMPPAGEPLEPDTTIDISHEILMRVWMRLKAWSEEEAQSARAYRRLAETAELHRIGKAGLWDDPDLQAALEWREREQPNNAWANLYREGFGPAMEFLEASKRVRDRAAAEQEFEKRFRKIQPFLAICVLLVFMSVSPRVSRVLSGGISDILNAVFEDRLGTFHGWRRWIAEGIGYQVAALLCLAAYFALRFVGKRGYRRVAFPGIEREIALAPALSVSAPDGSAAATGKSAAAPVQLQQTLIPAPFWRYLGAGLLDLVVFLIAIIFWFIVFSTVSVRAGGDSQILIFFGSVPLIAWLLPALTTMSRMAGTVGDLVFRIRLRRADGQTARWPRILGRYGVQVLSWVILIGPLGVFVHLFKRQQALVDLIARTRFMCRPPKQR